MRRRICLSIFAFAALVAVGVGVWTERSGGDVPLSPRAAAERLVEQCEWQAAREACTALLVASPNDGEVLQWRGRCHLALGQWDEALADFTRAIADRPRDAETLYYRSMVHRRLGHQDLADADFTAARAIDPHQNKLLAAMRADQAESTLRNAEQAAARRVQDQAARRVSPQADRVEAIASAARRASAATSMETEQASEDMSPSKSPFGDRPTLADLWRKDGGEMAEPEVALSWTRTAALTQGASDAEKRRATPYGQEAFPREGHRALARWDQPGGAAEPPAKADEPPVVDGRRVNLPEPQQPRPQPAMTAWERFRQDQGEARRRSRLELPPRQRSYDRASEEPTAGSSRQQNASDSAEPTAPSGKYPIRAISVYDATQPSGLLQASRAHAVTAMVPAGPAGSRPGSRVSRREPAAPLSTAMVPLPEAATDMSAATAALRPGVLSTAVYELLTPPEPPKDSPLTTQAAPLPDWIAPPSFAAPR